MHESVIEFLAMFVYFIFADPDKLNAINVFLAPLVQIIRKCCMSLLKGMTWHNHYRMIVRDECSVSSVSLLCVGQPVPVVASSRTDAALFEEVLWQQTAEDAENELDEQNLNEQQVEITDVRIKEGLLFFTCM